MLQGSYVEQITELFQTDDLSASELFPVMFQINIGGGGKGGNTYFQGRMCSYVLEQRWFVMNP